MVILAMPEDGRDARGTCRSNADSTRLRAVVLSLSE
jgi:hypothetical protein